MVEKNILIEAQNGNDEAIEKIMKIYENTIYKNSRFFFLKDGDFNDLLQEGYIGLIRAIKCYDEKRDACFSTFANLCIRRQMITAVKKCNSDKYKNLNQAMQGESYSDKEEKINYKAPSLTFYTPEEILLGKELVKMLEEYLVDNLSNLEKKVFYYLIKQQSYVEIAEVLNETPKKIDNTIQRIKKKVRGYLETYTKEKVYSKKS